MSVTIDELDALPDWSIVVGQGRDGARVVALKPRAGIYPDGVWELTASDRAMSIKAILLLGTDWDVVYVPVSDTPNT